MLSCAASVPPFLNSGETHATRPVTSEVTVAFSDTRTEPVSSRVNACSVGMG